MTTKFLITVVFPGKKPLCLEAEHDRTYMGRTAFNYHPRATDLLPLYIRDVFDGIRLGGYKQAVFLWDHAGFYFQAHKGYPIEKVSSGGWAYLLESHQQANHQNNPL